ncbi:MAG TPA: glycoside hydrolase family 71/99-like protein [Pirellulales bacterium]|nr:glycoside hydrolase family 71/99-like protein [Pirellulales bacterium]
MAQCTSQPLHDQLHYREAYASRSPRASGKRTRPTSVLLYAAILVVAVFAHAADAAEAGDEVDAATIKQKTLCGYQGWFRCPGDPANGGWRHWSRDAKRIGPDTLTFEMWPDLSEYEDDEKYTAIGFTGPDGSPAQLFSSDNAKTVERHFCWMRQHGIDGVFLQHFLVDLPGGPLEERYASRKRVLGHVIQAAEKAGRVWALSYDVAGMPGDKIYDVLTTDWKRIVDQRLTAGRRYLTEKNKPVVQVWGFYRHSSGIAMTAELAHRLIDFFKADGPYSAYLVGGGDWQWRRDEEWQKIVFRFDAYAPWNVGNYSQDANDDVHASMGWWEADKRACEAKGVLWLPVVYPGFGWDNLKRLPAGASTIPRRRGEFFWEQFHELARLKVSGAYIAMFDEVDEGTAIFKVSNTPPTPGRFLTYEGLPADWYLRLAGEGTKLLRGERQNQRSIPIEP